MEKQENKSFIFGLAAGVAVISTLALIGLLIYIFTGGRSACLTGGGTADGSDKAKTKAAKQFEECLASTNYDGKIQADQAQGAQLGVQGTPASFINGYLVSGALPVDMVKQVIDALLAGKEPDMDFLKDQETGKITKVDMPQITDQDHKIGATNGKVTILEYSDFECPYCSRFKTQTMDQILKSYPNDVTLVFKHFPLSFHQNAKPAAVASECANAQGKFWEMYDKLFTLSGASKLTLDNIKAAAVELGLK